MPLHFVFHKRDSLAFYGARDNRVWAGGAPVQTLDQQFKIMSIKFFSNEAKAAELLG